MLKTTSRHTAGSFWPKVSPKFAETNANVNLSIAKYFYIRLWKKYVPLSVLIENQEVVDEFYRHSGFHITCYVNLISHYFPRGGFSFIIRNNDKIYTVGQGRKVKLSNFFIRCSYHICYHFAQLINYPNAT